MFLMCVLADQVPTGDDYFPMDTKDHLQEHWIWYWIDKLFEQEKENVQLKSRLHHLQLVGQAVVTTRKTNGDSFRFMLCPSLMFSYWICAAANTVTL